MSKTIRIKNLALKAILPCVAGACLLFGGYRVHATDNSKASWEQPRELADFQSLLDHSPFSLPTAEESSPLADRYALTGIASINGEEEIFVFDRTDQTRTMLTHSPNPQNMSLVSLVREGTNIPQKATIRVGGDTGTIAYMEAAPQQALPNAQISGTLPNTPLRPNSPNLPPLPQLPNTPNGVMGPSQQGIRPNTRRIIRRPMVAPPQAQ